MSRMTRIGAAASAFALLLAFGVQVVRAQQAADATAAAPADPNAVVARIGETTITEHQLALAREYFDSELARVPEAQKRAVVIEAFVNMEVLAQAAQDAGLDKTEDFAARLAFVNKQALRNAYVRNEIIGGLSDEDLQQAYQKLVVGPFKPEEEVRARHILVETKEAAEKIIADLAGGASFEELAKAQSKDPTGQNGGDLGFFGKGRMVPEFEAAAFALEPGETTKEPVQSKYGWHVIRVEEKRMSEPPPFAEVEPQLRNYLLRERFAKVLGELRDKYKVEIVGEAAPAGSPDAAAPAPAEPAAKE